MIIIVSNKPKDVTFMICSPPRGWPGLAGHGEVVSHRDGEVGALAPLTGLSPGPGRAAHRAGAHGQTDPLPGPAQRVRCGARHPALRGRAGHPHQPLTSLTRARWTQKILMTSEVQSFFDLHQSHFHYENMVILHIVHCSRSIQYIISLHHWKHSQPSQQLKLN